MSNWKSFCCDAAKGQLEYYCEQHGYDCPDKVLEFRPAYKDEHFDLPARFQLIAPNAAYRAKYCPWCAAELKEHCVPNEIMDTISLKKIAEQTVKVYRGTELLGEATQTELNDLRIQVKRAKAEGYAVCFNDIMIPIHPNGKLSEWPDGMHDLWDKQLRELIDWNE